MPKKKEPEVQIDEALYLAKKELKTSWVYSEPLFTVLTDEAGKNVLIPLDSSFGKKRTILTFLDPTLLEADECLNVVKTWIHRYRDEDLSFILIMNCPFPTLLNHESILRALKKHSLICPTLIDSDRSVTRVFNIESLPSVIMYDLSLPGPILRPVKTETGDWVFEGETLIQKVLRDRDPGLPLEFVMRSKASKIKDKQEIVFTRYKELNPKEFLTEKDRIIPKINLSKIHIHSDFSNFVLIARLENPSDEKTRINVYIDDNPVFQQYAGEDFLRDDSGQSFIIITEPRPYHILQRVNLKSYKITLEFPSVERVKVGVYSALLYNT